MIIVPVPSRLPAACHRGEVHLYIQLIRRHKLGRGAARNQRAKLITIAHAARMLFQNFADRRAHRQLPGPRLLDPAAHPVDLGAAVFGAAQLPEPVGPVLYDVGNVADGLDVIDNSGFAPEAHHRREGRFGPRCGPAPFQSVEQGCFFPADVSPGAAMKI